MKLFTDRNNKKSSEKKFSYITRSNDLIIFFNTIYSCLYTDLVSTVLHIYSMFCNINGTNYSQCYFTTITCCVRFIEYNVINYTVIVHENIIGDHDLFQEHELLIRTIMEDSMEIFSLNLLLLID